MCGDCCLGVYTVRWIKFCDLWLRALIVIDFFYNSNNIKIFFFSLIFLIRNKEEGYFIASELLKKICASKKGAKAIRGSPALMKRLNNLVEELSRKAATNDKRLALIMIYIVPSICLFYVKFMCTYWLMGNNGSVGMLGTWWQEKMQREDWEKLLSSSDSLHCKSLRTCEIHIFFCSFSFLFFSVVRSIISMERKPWISLRCVVECSGQLAIGTWMIIWKISH